jgi:hypothetical protein
MSTVDMVESRLHFMVDAGREAVWQSAMERSKYTKFNTPIGLQKSP